MSLRTFFASVVSNEDYAKAWAEGKDSDERNSLIAQSPDLTKQETDLLLVGNEFLISLRMVMFEPTSGVPSWVPGKEGGPPGPVPDHTHQ
jgi:hypothetical protein